MRTPARTAKDQGSFTLAADVPAVLSLAL